MTRGWEMSENGRKKPLPASEVYDHPIYGKVVRYNFALNHPDEEIARHRGRYVAWSMDGSQVFASGATMNELFDETDRLGLEGGNYVVAYIPEDS
jgi:hypothetical protein